MKTTNHKLAAVIKGKLVHFENAQALADFSFRSQRVANVLHTIEFDFIPQVGGTLTQGDK